jgi:hypothetical protein
LDRRREDKDRQQERIATLKRQVADADAKLTRLYAAIENGVADLLNENLKGRLAELKMVRDAARADVERAAGKGSDRPVEVTPLRLFGDLPPPHASFSEPKPEATGDTMCRPSLSGSRLDGMKSASSDRRLVCSTKSQRRTRS